MGSDHRPVYGIYELEIQLPYHPLVPLYIRPNILEGVIKFHEIEIDYYYKMMSNISFPCEISFSFYAPFLVNNPSSTQVLIDKVIIYLFLLENFFFSFKILKFKFKFFLFSMKIFIYLKIENFKEEGFKSMKWNEDMIPLIFLSIGDQEFLKRKSLILILGANSCEKDNETIFGKILIILFIFCFL